MTLISSTRFFNGALLAGAMALISTEVAVAQPAPGTADSSGRLVQTWDKTFPRSEKVDHQKVTFKNRYGITLAADVYLPKDRGNKKLAALVISGPFGAVKEQASGLYAQTLAERGFVTLAFDPSYTGESSGEPRNGRDGTRHLSAENEAGIFLIITSVADQARLIHTAGGALSNEHFIWHPVTRSVRKCNSSKICRTVQAAGVAE